MSDLAQVVISGAQELFAGRATWEDHWRQVAQRVCPRLDEFQGQRTPGGRRTEYQLDSTAAIGLERFGAAMEGFLCPQGQTWHTLRCRIPEVQKLPRVQRYLDQVTRALFDARYAPSANFQQQFHEVQLHLGLFGTAPFWVDEQPGKGLVYRSVHLAEIAVCENQHGLVDTVYRMWQPTLRQVAQRFGQDNLPPKARDTLRTKPESKIWMIQCLRPREDWNPEALNSNRFPIESIVVARDERHVVATGGYSTMPLLVSRYVTSAREVYGRSPAMTVLPDIKMANQIASVLIKRANFAADPPLAAADDGVLSRVQWKPGKVTVGALNMRGEYMVRPMELGGDPTFAMEMLNQSRAIINDAFLVTLFQVLRDGPEPRSAAAVLERVRERGILLAPSAGRQHTEVLGPMIEREIDLLARMGWLPPMPEELREVGGAIRVVYDNPLSRAARSEGAAGFLQYVQQVAPLAQSKPEVLDIFDWETMLPELAQINGVPARWLADLDAMRQRTEQRQMQTQGAELAQATQFAADAQLKIAKAESLNVAA